MLLFELPKLTLIFKSEVEKRGANIVSVLCFKEMSHQNEDDKG